MKEDRSRETRLERGSRDFAALRDPTRKNQDSERSAPFREEEKMRREDREYRREDRETRREERDYRRDDRDFRRDDREIRRAPPVSSTRDGETNWRAARGQQERPIERGNDQQISRPSRQEREERDRPSIRFGEKEREKPKCKIK